jgi:GT2 family glycosyltransferase
VRTSVVIITRDEQPRLRLCLASLGRQTVRWGTDAEVIVVDDGSATPVGPSECLPSAPPVRIVRHATSRGRSASRNAGASLAQGDRLLFLDGDVLMSPEAVAQHGALEGLLLGRGEQRHIRSTRFFADPSTGVPWPGKEARLKSMGDLTPHLVTEQAVVEGPFEALLARSDEAIYPGAAPRRLYEIEMGALRRGSAPLAEWMAASGHNFSVPRGEFQAAGGFDGAISINEHRELALRLGRRGARMRAVDAAISVHITHREGWRDPLAGEDGWEQAFARHHPTETDVMLRLWRSLAGDARVATEDRITTLEHADEALRRSGAASGGAS